jgi:hypothetical protein
VSIETTGIDSVIGNVIDVPRPPTRLSDEQQRLLDEAVAAAAEADAQVEAAWKKIKKARDAGVPDRRLMEETAWSRATLNRKYGARAQKIPE